MRAGSVAAVLIVVGAGAVWAPAAEAAMCRDGRGDVERNRMSCDDMYPEPRRR